MATSEWSVLAEHRGRAWAKKTILTDGTTGAASITTAAATSAADVTLESRVAIYVVNGADNSVVFDVQGSLDGTNFFDVSYRASGVTETAVGTDVTVTASSKAVLFLTPNNLVNFVRLNVGTANTTGTAVSVYHSSTP